MTYVAFNALCSAAVVLTAMSHLAFISSRCRSYSECQSVEDGNLNLIIEENEEEEGDDEIRGFFSNSVRNLTKQMKRFKNSTKVGEFLV